MKNQSDCHSMLAVAKATDVFFYMPAFLYNSSTAQRHSAIPGFFKGSQGNGAQSLP